jgi:hypothetical protein
MEGKKQAVEALYAPLRHIEVVSVILRFVYPTEFGNISPPLISLLNLVPAEKETHPNHYLRYLSTLKDLADHYGRYYSSLQNLAKVDMGLWAAAHLSTHSEYASLADAMHKDEFFQEIRLKNLAEGLGSHWTKTYSQRLILARVLLNHDSILATLIASRAFESIVFGIISRSGIQLDDLGEDRDNLYYITKKITDRSALLNKLEVSASDLHAWRKCRNDTVHPKTGRPPMTSNRGQDFVCGVQKLYDNLPKLG